MKFRIVDKRICDYLDYENIGRNLGKNEIVKIENNNSLYKVYWESMSPSEYIRRCAKMMGININRLIESRNDDSLDKLYPNINQGNYGIIYIDTFNKMQDGLHRAIILMLKKVPKINVLVITKSNGLLKDSNDIIKGIIFENDDNLTNDKFTDFIGNGLAKLGDDTYIHFWHDTTFHQNVTSKYKNAKNVVNFATSNINGKLDTYDFERLGKYNKYKDILITKARKYFGI